MAADDVIRDAVVTAEHERGDQAEHLLRPGRKDTIQVRLMVEREESLDVEIGTIQNHIVEPLSLLLPLLHRRVSVHVSSPSLRTLLYTWSKFGYTPFMDFVIEIGRRERKRLAL